MRNNGPTVAFVNKITRVLYAHNASCSIYKKNCLIKFRKNNKSASEGMLEVLSADGGGKFLLKLSWNMNKNN